MRNRKPLDTSFFPGSQIVGKRKRKRHAKSWRGEKNEKGRNREQHKQAKKRPRMHVSKYPRPGGFS